MNISNTDINVNKNVLSMSLNRFLISCVVFPIKIQLLTKYFC